MKTYPAIASLVVFMLVTATTANAQTVNGMTADSKPAAVGQPVKVTVTFEPTEVANCGIHMHWGDGADQTFKVNQKKDIPLVATHAYTKPGNYRIVAEPKRVGAVLKCGGPNQAVTVDVGGAATAATAPAPVQAAAPSVCPPGWKLAKPADRKTGAFTCTAAPNTKVPDGKLACPGDLTYFENGKKGQLGCRP